MRIRNMARPDEQGQHSSEEPEAFIGQEGADGFDGVVVDDLEGEGKPQPIPSPISSQHARSKDLRSSDFAFFVHA